MSDSRKKITRRGFALGAAAAAVGVLAPGSEVQAQSEPPKPSTQAAPATKLSPEAQAEVDAKIKEIFRKYGSRLTNAQKTDILKVMAETQSGLEKMRAFPLDNADQPATVLKFTEGEKQNGRD
jgi:hypothetical protein